MIDCVGSGECVNVNFGLRKRFAHAGKGTRTIFKKDRELRCVSTESVDFMTLPR